MPARRPQGLLSEEIGEETLIVDPRSATVHTLDADASRVWHACDGASAPAAIAAELGLTETVVAATIDRLTALELLEGADTVSRRTALRRLALAGASVAALPVITSLAIPTAAQALSGPPGQGGGTVRK